MGKILISGAVIIPADDEAPDFFTGDVLIDGDRIAALARRPERLESSDADRVIDGAGLLVMPGFVNTHGHAAMVLFRSYADDMPLQEWLQEKIWPIEAHLEAEDVYWGTLLAIAEMLKSGTTTFTDMYFFVDRVALAVAESGIRAVLSRGLVGLGDSAEEGLRDSAALVDEWHGRAGGRINISLGPHAPYTCPPEYLQRVIDLAERTGRPLQIHLSETEREVADCRQEHGCSPVELMEKVGLFNYPVVGAHCVHLSGNDIDILARYKVGVAHNPGSNLKLGSGIAPVKQLLEKGVKVGIGTDGASSNNNLDMLEEMRLAALLQKGLHREPTLVPARTALRMATAWGAEILSLPETGRLKVGYKADLIAFNRNVPHLQPLHDPLAHIVYAAGADAVTLVMVDGEILVEDGKLTVLDEEKIYAEASQRAARLAAQAKQS